MTLKITWTPLMLGSWVRCQAEPKYTDFSNTGGGQGIVGCGTTGTVEGIIVGCGIKGSGTVGRITIGYGTTGSRTVEGIIIRCGTTGSGTIESTIVGCGTT